MCYLLRLCIITIYLTNGNPCYGGEWHNSISSMYGLFDLENDLLVATEKYIKKEHKRLNDIKSFIEKREAQNEKELAEAYTESSINAFKTILRVKNDWEMLKNRMAPSSVMKFDFESVPKKDVTSALNALRRLQIVYEFEVDELTNGQISDYIFEKFSADDCYRMADFCFQKAEFHCAFHWFDETFKKLNENSNGSRINYELFTGNYAWSAYLVGNIKKARNIIEHYSNEMNYALNDVLTNVRYIVWNENPVFKRNTAQDPDKKFYSHSFQNLDWNDQVKYFIDVCQHQGVSRRSCSFYYGYDPFLWIGPLRQETISTNAPVTIVFHNVLYDSEINRIKELARPMLNKVPTDTNEDITLRKVAKLRFYDDPIFDDIADRILLMTAKRNTRVFNRFTVTNYGLGGHYLPHNSYVDQEHLLRSNDNVALIIFQLDDVPAGGATVIPDLFYKVESTKGSAIIIYNMPKITSPFGLPMFEHTQYGSCPIFYGDKWTMSAWLRESKPTGCAACQRRPKYQRN